jgi:hypothetical protein
MFNAGIGLTSVPTEHLKLLLKIVYKGEVAIPIHIHDLTRFGLQGTSADLLHHLRGLDAAALQAVLVAVLAERRSREENLPIGRPRA